MYATYLRLQWVVGPIQFHSCLFVVVVWAREVSPFSRRKASVYVQAVVW